MNILVVDDDVSFGNILESMLIREAPGCSIAVVKSGPECLDHVNTHLVDCILSDYQMPEMDGMELLKLLRTRGNSVPFIFLTAHGSEKVAREAFKNGAFDYFLKEETFLQFERLTNSIEQAVEKSRAEASRQAAEAELRDSIERFKTLFESANDGILLNDNGVYVDCNSKAMEYYGFENKSDLIGKNPAELAPPLQPDGTSSQEKVISLARDTLAGVPQRFYWQYLRTDGSLRDADASLNRVCIKGRYFILGIVRDITERRRTEEALRENEERFRTLFESANDGIFLVGESGFIECNQTGARMYGYDEPADVIGRTVLEFSVSPQPDGSDPAEKIQQVVADTMRGIGHKFTWRNRRRDGSLMDVEVSLNTVTLKGTKYIQAIVRDITERRKLEEQRAHLLEILRHDMKTPLSVISGNAELMLTEKEDVLEADTAGMLKSIIASTRYLSRMLDDQVAIFSIGMTNTKEFMDGPQLEELVVEASMSISGLARKKGLPFKLDIAGALPPAVIDRPYLLRALANLGQNAVNYTPAGGSIRLSAGTLEHSAEKFLYIEVADDGPGIPPEEHEKVFEKYYRTEAARSCSGSGLGLAIVKAVAEEHGGHVELESEAGKGSTFRIVLPAFKNPA